MGRGGVGGGIGMTRMIAALDTLASPEYKKPMPITATPEEHRDMMVAAHNS